MKITVEANQGDGWAMAGAVAEGDMLGSVTDETSGTDVYLFGFRDGRPGVWRAIGGVGQTFGELRKIETLGLEEISNLDEPYETPVVHPDLGLMRVRWSLVAD